MELNFVQILSEEKYQNLINDQLDLEIDWERIHWVVGLCDVSKGEEIFEAYLKEVYNLTLEDISAALWNVEEHAWGFSETKEIKL